MQKSSRQGWLSRVAVTGIAISLFSIAVFPVEINAAPAGILSQNMNYFAPNSRSMQPVFNVGVDCMYLTETVNTNIAKTQSSSRDTVQLFNTASGFYADSLYPGKYICFSDKIPRKSFRQVCLVLDLPPPAI